MRVFNGKRVKIAKGLDRSLKWLYPVMQHILPTHCSHEAKRLLVFEAWLLGDFVMATSAFRFLRQRFPDARIDCIGPPMLSGLEPFFPWLDHIIPFRCPWSHSYRDYSFKSLRGAWKLAMELRESHYDWAFDLRGDLRDIVFLYATGAARRAGFDITGAGDLLTHVIPYQEELFSHQIEGNFLVVSWPFGCSPTPADFRPKIHIPPVWQRQAGQWLLEHGIKEFIGVHPCASRVHNLWPASSWAELLNEVVLPRYPVILFGLEHEKDFLNRITSDLKRMDRVQTACVSLPLFFSLVSLARGMITLDSAAAHIAAAVDIPVVALHGPNHPSLTGAYTPHGRGVCLENVPCRPCFTVCTQPRNFCMQDLPLSMVVSALGEVGIL